MVKSTSCSSRVPGFDSQHLQDSSQLQFQGIDVFCWPLQAHTWSTDTHADKTPIHINITHLSKHNNPRLTWDSVELKGKNSHTHKHTHPYEHTLFSKVNHPETTFCMVIRG